MTFGIEKQMDQLDALEQMDNPKVAEAVTDALVELERAERLHPDWPSNILLAGKIVDERVLKLSQQTIQFHPDIEKARRRAIQVVAMGLRFLKNLESA